MKYFRSPSQIETCQVQIDPNKIEAEGKDAGRQERRRSYLDASFRYYTILRHMSKLFRLTNGKTLLLLKTKNSEMEIDLVELQNNYLLNFDSQLIGSNKIKPYLACNIFWGYFFSL
ncbi:hypothetical protein AVEN_253658-1 [Araneus ventricosus]|uniref:Uncharacterized protein n=1 Tax=Araneus ventricosus TaxID=182803 RepID=A0A4Y2VPJ1_ARAVE|nr:hypothetical protein AVEN_253658-1 [Araneus ventricosus]